MLNKTGDKRQSETLFLAMLDLRSSIVQSVFDCRISGVIKVKCIEQELVNLETGKVIYLSTILLISW